MNIDLWWIVVLIVVYIICLLIAKASRNAGVATALMVVANVAVIVFLVYVLSKM